MNITIIVFILAANVFSISALYKMLIDKYLDVLEKFMLCLLFMVIPLVTVFAYVDIAREHNFIKNSIAEFKQINNHDPSPKELKYFMLDKQKAEIEYMRDNTYSGHDLNKFLKTSK